MTEVPPLFSVLFPCPSVFSQRMATRKGKRTPGGKEAQKSRKPVTKGSKFQQPNRCGIMDCVLIIRPPRRPVARYRLYVYQTARGIYSAKEIREAYQATVESLTKKLKDALSRSDCRSLDCDSDFGVSETDFARHLLLVPFTASANPLGVISCGLPLTSSQAGRYLLRHHATLSTADILSILLGTTPGSSPIAAQLV
ncbi:hypothetical protein B0H14DRAFT_2731215 [Mycena olivaceomarginata]|nr:hypothetical protein B0H14DRAFT_2731215 [Mycena olivaceomarginata]